MNSNWKWKHLMTGLVEIHLCRGFVWGKKIEMDPVLAIVWVSAKVLYSSISCSSSDGQNISDLNGRCLASAFCGAFVWLTVKQHRHCYVVTL